MSDKEFTEEELKTNSESILLPFTIGQTAEEIAARIAKSLGTDTVHLLGPSRYNHIVQGRRELYKALRAKGWSYPAIGQFANRDHTTIIAAINGRR